MRDIVGDLMATIDDVEQMEAELCDLRKKWEGLEGAKEFIIAVYDALGYSVHPDLFAFDRQEVVTDIERLMGIKAKWVALQKEGE